MGCAVDTKNIKQSVGKKIKFFREKCGFTQEELSERVEISQNYLSTIERGVSFPSPGKLVLIIDELGISADQLFEDVIKNSFQIKSSVLSEKIQHLSLDGQKLVLSVLDVLIQEIENRY